MLMYIKFVKNYLKKYIKTIILIEILLLGQVIAKVFVPKVFSIIIDINLPAKDRRALNICVLILALLYIGDAILGYLQSYLIAVVQGDLGERLRKELNGKVGKWKFEIFDQVGLADVIARYGKEVEIIKRNIAYLITNFFKNIFTLLMGSVVFFSTNPCICFITILISMIYLINNIVWGKKIKAVALENIENNAESLECITENYKSVLLTKSYNINNFFNQKFDDIYKKQYNSEIKLMSLKSANIYAGFIILSFICIFIWLIGGHAMIRGNITIGEIIALINYQGMIVNPMNSFSTFINNLEEAKVSIERIMEYLDLEEEVAGGLELDRVNEIKLVQVDFTYKNREKVLSKMCFSISRGEVVALVGRSGSGKSTIGKLLINLYKPDSGVVLLNGISVSQYNVYRVRDKILFISQESLFLHDTILNNLKMYRAVQYREIEYYCDELDIKNEITEMPLRYNTVIDINTGNLSGGQKKRLEIVRGLVRNADMYIFDEVESSLDEKRRILFWNIIRKLKQQGKLIIIITHYAQETKYFDKIIDLDRNKNSDT